MKKKLVIFELNEFDYNFFLYGSRKYNFPEIKKFFNLKKKQTITKDKKEGFNLDPWVQWVSAHTGKSSKDHKVFRIGQVLNKKIKQVWEKLPQKISVSIWGLFNSNLRKKKNIDLFYPDPWSFTQRAFPADLNSFLALPRYYARNYPKFNFLYVLKYSLILLKKIIFSKIFLYVCINFVNFLIIFFKSGIKSFNIYFIFDLFSLILLNQNLNKKKSDLTIIGLNSFAHYQHNYWNKPEYEKIYFWYLNQMILQMKQIAKNYENIIIFNGFSQKKVKVKYYPRIINQEKFFKDLNINMKKHEINMTTGGTIYFKNLHEKKNTMDILKQAAFLNKRLFYVSDFKKQKKIFYSLNIVFLNKFKFEEISKLNKSKIRNNKQLFDKIINNTKFSQSTSRHINKGIIFFSPKIKLKQSYFIKKNFYNQKFFNLIIDLFKQ